jgi:mannosyltransferase OCH1-like enzyme
MIPKLIHQTAKDRNIPPKWQGYQKKLQDLHPGWTYKLWTDEDNLAFVKKEFPEFLDIYQKLPRGIMRADVIRYLLMYKLGGLYMDLDYEMLKPFDLMDKDIVLPWESSGEFGAGNDRLGNSFFASKPGHPFFKLAIDDLSKNPPLAPDVEILGATGPLFITRMYHAATAAKIDMYTPARPLFNPVTPHSPRAYRAIVKKGTAYGIHHCHGTWREYSFPRRVKNRVVSAIKWFF